MGVPEEDIIVKALGSKTAQNSRKIRNISLLGSSEAVQWAQEKDKLTITCPSSIPCEEAIVYKVTLR